MILAPTTTPPPARPLGVASTKTPSPLKDSTSHNVPVVSLDPKAQEDTSCGDRECVKSHTELFDRLNVPTVVLDAPSVSHTMAASLSLSLLGHTLFLKSQVPFPIAQLMRMPGGGSNPKVTKKREELLATFDTLSSHLQTTFVALSTAYAKCQSAKCKAAVVPGDENSQKGTQPSAISPAGRRAAHLMFLLGPSVGAARAKIILTIDGLDVKVWGEREHAPPTPEDSDDEGSIDIESSEEEDDDGDEEDYRQETDEEEDSRVLSDENSVANSDQVSEEEDELDELDTDDGASAPPASRSPSPSPPMRSLAPSPESPEVLLNKLPSPHQSSPLTTSAAPPLSTLAPLSVSAAPNRSTPACSSASTFASRQSSPATTRAPAPMASYAQEQAALRAAERLLSRTLMTAWADGGGDMASELAPTQTHVYLRAPRRFAHPAWVARQNLARTLDAVLDGHLVEAGAVPPPQGFKSKKGRGVRTEGVWVGCTGGSAFAAGLARQPEVDNDSEGREGTNGEDEEDEEIWWAWDGKIVGFADW
ncbi:hypothetical protein C8Q78DRAFT_475156 [Trametes maxima]|nr:hypothetical protein C8Q78DRAFT_475156 [Trametes maxima]